MTILSHSDDLSVAPAVEPVSVADARRNSDVDDSYRDVDFSRWITEARKQVEHDSRLSLVNQTRIRKLDAFPSESYITLRAPLVSVSSISYIDTGGDSQTWSSAEYEVDTVRSCVHLLAHTYSYPTTRVTPNAVTITYISGHGATAATVPEAAKAAILLLCRFRHDEPGMTPEGYQDLINQLKGGFYP